MYKEVNVKEDITKAELRILEYWEMNNIAKKSEDFRKDNKKFIFYEGPPTANGMPGIHHVISRTIKDAVCRYKTMRGYQVKRKAGWDTHGLPVEIEVEKQLGIETKADIEEYGIEKFNQKCRESVFTYEKEWRQITKRIGYWLDMDNPYITLKPEYIESVWWLLHQFWKRGYIYQGYKIVPYCPKCGTPLSSHEVSQGYKETEDPSVFVKMKVKNQEDTYFLVWTTTPWTLLSNVALAVHPIYKYVKVKLGKEYFILAEKCLSVLKGNYKIIEKFTGAELEGMEYEQLFPLAKVNKKAFYVCLADFVTMDDGTGIVHIAPAFGEDDFQLRKKYNLPVLQPVDGEGKFTDEITLWKGLFVKDADQKIIEYMENNNILYYQSKIKHTYPFCWRCDTPLLYYARKSWYIKTTAFKDKMIENNKKINWYPPFVGEKRFGEWLENNIDWAISRNRYWGTPLNIWVCENCQNQYSVQSLLELRKGKMKNGDDVPADIDPHRPYVDEIYFKCPKCGGNMYRTEEVIDCWFDSGAMPFAQWHYPFEHKEEFDKELFPTDFICEAIDQTRGWFYTLLAISTFIKGVSSYKTCLVNDMVLDKYGKKMSKRLGNIVKPEEVINKYGADAIRWYFLSVSPPWVPTRFDIDMVAEVSRRFFSTLKNVYSFFVTYANIDKFNIAEYPDNSEYHTLLDKWVLSRLNTLIKNSIENNDKYEITRTVRQIQDFIIDDVSNWYVRRSRERYWRPDMTTDKISAYNVLYQILVVTSQLIAPFAPFIAEDIYTNLTGKESVHLTEFPIYDEQFIDKQLEKEMRIVAKIVSLARTARNNAQIKVRQPLSFLYVQKKYQAEVEKLKSLIIDEINVKNIGYVESKDGFSNYIIKPNYKVLGPKYGKHISKIAEALDNIDANHLVKQLHKEGLYRLDIDNLEVRLTENELVIDLENKEGYVIQEEGDSFVILDTRISKELRLEGNARELVNKIQFMRKENNFDITDRVEVKYFTDNDADIEQTFTEFGDYIKNETLALALQKQDNKDSLMQWNINGKNVWLKVEKR